MLKVIDIGHKNYGLDTAIAVLEAEVSKIMLMCNNFITK